MLYHQTKDILYVREFLGHKRIEDTMLYIQVAEAIFKETDDEFMVKIAKKPKEIQALPKSYLNTFVKKMTYCISANENS